MARYINEDDFVAWVKEHWCADCDNDNGLRCRVCWIDDAIDIVEEAPEADVVPKSEVEMLQGTLKAEERHNELTMKMAQKALENAKAEAYAEFAERVKAEMDTVARWSFHGDNNEYFIIGKPLIDQIAKELTEGKRDCRKCKHFVGCEQAVWTGPCDAYEEGDK